MTVLPSSMSMVGVRDTFLRVKFKADSCQASLSTSAVSTRVKRFSRLYVIPFEKENKMLHLTLYTACPSRALPCFYDAIEARYACP